MSSLWTFDEDSAMVTRVPLTEDPSHDFTSYEQLGAPTAYDPDSVQERIFHARNGPEKYFVFQLADGTPVQTGFIITEIP